MLVQKKSAENMNAAIKDKRDTQLQNKREEFSEKVKSDNKMIFEEEKVIVDQKRSDPVAGKATITLTYGDQAGIHRGMQKLGKVASTGLSVQDLEDARIKFEAKGCKCEIINLNDALSGTNKTGDKAAVLIARKAMDLLDQNLSADKLFDEQMKLKWDDKAFMYGKVVNKHARSNLSYGEEAQEPHYEKNKATVVAFKSIPCTSLVRKLLGDYFGEKGKNLMCDGFLYNDVSKCGLGFHGDTERKKVIAVRLGAPLALHFQWFCNLEPVGKTVKLMLNHGDIYVMSEKATGYDWRSKKAVTLRHAAGCEKFLVIEEKKAKPSSKKKGKKNGDSEGGDSDD